MLGQLLHSFNPVRRAIPSRNPPSLDSVTEDEHTKGLIFPGNDLLHAQDSLARTFPRAEFDQAVRSGLATDSAFADLDLECPRDVRILIAQGESSSLQELLLFDSKAAPSPESPNGKQEARLARSDTPTQFSTRPFGRVSTISAIPEDSNRQHGNIFGTGGGAFAHRARLRNGSVSSLPEEPTTARQKDMDEVVKIALDCMFENASSSYKGTSNKIHIVPLEPKTFDSAAYSTSLISDFASIQLGRPTPSFSRRPSTLSRSYAPGDEFLQAPRSGISSAPSNGRRRTVLITRTFSVSWTEDGEAINDAFALKQANGKTNPLQDQQRTMQAQMGFSQEPRSPTRASRIRAYRSPMYAITIVLHLPVSSGESPPPSRYGRASSRRKGSHASLGSSWDSDRRSGWAMVDPMFGIESLASQSIASDVDDRVDLVGQHWDIISRTLTTLQYLVQEKILEVLRPLPRLRRGVKLLHMALAHDGDVKKAAENACRRIVRGIKIQRVVTGQGRWGIWREEARWLGQWAGGRDENFFFFNLITAFLGTHTEWLNVLAPRAYRDRHREQQKHNAMEDLSVPARTIIVSTDKMAARRLIFLLSSFLPASNQLGGPGDMSPLRPSTAASVRAYSQSPPSHAPLSRQESLRRSINKRGKAARSRTRQHPSRGSNASLLQDSSDDRTETGTIRGAELESQSRRSSNARSILGQDLSLEFNPAPRKSSATLSSSVVTPSPAMPVPHFAYNRQNSSGAVPTRHRRQGSRESVASANLMSTLQRHNSGSTSNESGGKWGSLRSLWSMGTRRESSTEYSDVLQVTDEGLGITGVRQPEPLRSQLQQMADEGEQYRQRHQDRMDNLGPTPEQRGRSTPDLGALSPGSTRPASRPIDLPIKTSVNPDDGVIDVQIPFSDWGSPMQSPPMHGYTSGSSWGESSMNSSVVFQAPRDNEHPLNVAGWLDRLHPDFALQAIKPYPDLIKDIKTAMSAEPNPPNLALLASENGPTERWLEICTTLVADTSNFSIKRLRLHRLVKVIRQSTPNFVTPGFSTPPSRSHHANPYSQPHPLPNPITSEAILDEKFDEEKIMDFDGALADAIERLLSPSGSSSKAQSESSSRSSSRRGRLQREHHAPEDGSCRVPPALEIHAAEISRHDCKRFVFGALEQIVKSVARERRDARVKGDRLRDVDDSNSTLREGIVRWFDDVERGRGGEMGREQAETVRARSQMADDEVFSGPPAVETPAAAVAG